MHLAIPVQLEDGDTNFAVNSSSAPSIMVCFQQADVDFTPFYVPVPHRHCNSFPHL